MIAIAVTWMKDSGARRGLVAGALATVVPRCRSTIFTLEANVSTPICATSTPA